MRGPDTIATTVIHEPQRKLRPRPRDYWIYDQVVRRKRNQEEVAEDVNITQGRVSQIVSDVAGWMDQIWDECVPEVEEEALRATTYLMRLRLRAQAEGRAPQDEYLPHVIAEFLGEIEGLSVEKPGAKET
jgi:hypothetical protein